MLQKKIYLKAQLGFSNGFMVEKVGLGGGLIMLWQAAMGLILMYGSKIGYLLVETI